MNFKVRRQIIDALPIEAGKPPPPSKVKAKRPDQGTAWRGLVDKVKPGDSIVIPLRWLCGLQSVARAAGWEVRSQKLGCIPWTNAVPLSKITTFHHSGNIHQTRVWFLKS